MSATWMDRTRAQRFRPINKRELAGRLTLSCRTVSRAFRRLEAERLLEAARDVSDEGRLTAYRLVQR